MQVNAERKGRGRSGFTLVELVVVVLIMGIIAAVALPKMTSNTNVAKTNSAKHSLATIRDALELYKNDKGNYPASEATLVADLKPYLKGPFPAAPMGNGAGSNTVGATTTDPATTIATGGIGWLYNSSTGDFYLNDDTGKAW